MATSSPTYTREYAYFFRGKDLVVVEKDYQNSTSLTYGKFKSPNKSLEDGIQIEYVYKPFGILEDPTRFHLITNITDSSGGGLRPMNALNTGDYQAMIKVTFSTLHGDVTADYEIGSHVYLRHTTFNSGVFQVRDKQHGSGATTVALTKVAGVQVQTEGKDVNQASVASHDSFIMLCYPKMKRIGDPDTELPYDDYLCTALVYYVKARLAEDMGNIEMKEYFMREFYKRISENENARVAGLRLINPGSHAIK